MTQTNRVAVITGAAGGVGQSTVKSLLSRATQSLAPISEYRTAYLNMSVFHRACDVTSEFDWQALSDAVIAEHGKLDVLVNNAAILMTYTIETSSVDDTSA